MRFCAACGAEASPEGRFCVSCGATLVAGSGAVLTAGAALEEKAFPAGIEVARGCVLGAIGIYAVSAVLVLVAGNLIGTIIAVALSVLPYSLVLSRAESGAYVAARAGSFALAAAAVVLVFVNVGFHDGGAALVNAVAAGLLALAGFQLEK